MDNQLGFIVNRIGSVRVTRPEFSADLEGGVELLLDRAAGHSEEAYVLKFFAPEGTMPHTEKNVCDTTGTDEGMTFSEISAMLESLVWEAGVVIQMVLRRDSWDGYQLTAVAL
jgi:hypothetical protein